MENKILFLAHSTIIGAHHFIIIHLLLVPNEKVIIILY